MHPKAIQPWRENPAVTRTLFTSCCLPVCAPGGEFLRKFARLSNGGGEESGGRQWKCAFCLTRDGRVVKVQRTIFSECFYVLALDELSRVTGDQDMQVDSLLGRGRG